jgi:hypothetical protein
MWLERRELYASDTTIRAFNAAAGRAAKQEAGRDLAGGFNDQRCLII